MSHLQATWRRLIAVKGRPMTLRRQTAASPVTFTDVSVRAASAMYQPDQITEGLKQGDRKLSILNDEIAAAGWPGPPRTGDKVLVDSTTLNVLGSVALYDGTALVGHRMSVRG